MIVGELTLDYIHDLYKSLNIAINLSEFSQIVNKVDA